jgi:hypothetical protein
LRYNSHSIKFTWFGGFVVLILQCWGSNSLSLCILGKHSITEIHPRPINSLCKSVPFNGFQDIHRLIQSLPVLVSFSAFFFNQLKFLENSFLLRQNKDQPSGEKEEEGMEVHATVTWTCHMSSRLAYLNLSHHYVAKTICRYVSLFTFLHPKTC